MKQMIKRTILTGAIAILLVPTIASAHEGHEHGDDPVSNDDASEQTTDDREAPDKQHVQRLRAQIDARLKAAREDRMNSAEDAKAAIRERLNEAKKKICEKHETKINDLIARINTRREKAFDRITEVSEAVQSYYADKNLSTADYDDLVAAVEAAEEAAQAALTTQLSAPKLRCDGEAPKADMSEFRTKHSDSVDALKEYRDAVKALVRAVKEAAKDSEGDA